jgi:acyl-CoA thioesterase-1
MTAPATPLLCALALAGCDSEVRDLGEAEPGRFTDGEAPVPVMGEEVDILAFGDSLFAGYNVEEGQTYPAVLENVLRVRGINADITNAGVSGDTTAAGLQRIEFVLENEEDKPDLAIVELGGNDLLRGISPAETRTNLAAILTELQERDIPVLLMGMRAPPNLGEAFMNDFDTIYPDLAEQFDAELVPFFLEPVYDEPTLMQADRVHPTAAGIEELVMATADDVAAAIEQAEPSSRE